MSLPKTHRTTEHLSISFSILSWVLVHSASPALLVADNVPLLNGLELRGEIGTTKEIGEVAGEFSAGGSIIIVDDGLRRTFVPAKQSAPIVEEAFSEDIFRIEQSVANSVDIIRGVGKPLRISPFNLNGRREIILAGPDGPRRLIQGITKITPTYCVLETLTLSKFNVQWESRVSTSQISREILSSLIKSQSDPANPNDRMKIVQLLIEAERYRDAVTELEQVIDDFPDLTDKQALADLLRQSYARQILSEIKLRNAAGQSRQVEAMLRQFPTAGIAGDLLAQVLQLQQKQTEERLQVADILTELEKLTADIKQGTALDSEQQLLLDEIVEEITRDLSPTNLPRLAGFFQFRDDASHSVEQKLAFAISGWLLGDADLTGNLQIALANIRTRAIVREYLTSRSATDRESLLASIGEQENADVPTVARLIKNLTPPTGFLETVSTETNIPGCFEVQDNTDRPFRYWVQLPPEYDPYRRYPCVVTLNGDHSPLEQIAWWAGEFDDGSTRQRLGQASRHGYIVIAVEWRRENQWIYEYSPDEHARVLNSLRDARRRYSIDSDKTFISGHSVGGDAAWDIALSHPDLWAGLIGIGATAEKYVNHYHTNAIGTLPMYFVHGELDHARMASNKADWNRYLRAAGNDIIIATYQGRGHEHFQEEIFRLFDWMNLHTRVIAPKALEIRTMRPWDNFFWWIEMNEFPNATQVAPAEWPARDRSAALLSAEIDVVENKILIKDCAAARAKVMLYPEMIDFTRPLEIRFKGDRFRPPLSPRIEVLLEDARTRSDRQHPFWATIELP